MKLEIDNTLFQQKQTPADILAEASLMPLLVHSTYNPSRRSLSLSASTAKKSIKQIVLGTRAFAQGLKTFDGNRIVASRIGQSVHSTVEALWGDVAGIVSKMKKLKVDSKLIEALQDVDQSDISIEQSNELQMPNGVWITGTYDLSIRNVLMDYKVVGVFAYTAEKLEKDYKLAMSIYRLINPEKDLDAVAYLLVHFKDWSEGFKAYAEKLGNRYPPKANMAIPVQLFTRAETMEKLVKLTDEWLIQNQNSELEVNKLVCDSETLWQGEGVYKYFKTATAKRATKVFKDKGDKNAYLIKNPSASSGIRHFPDEPKACLWCDGSPLCTQGLANIAKMESKK